LFATCHSRRPYLSQTDGLNCKLDQFAFNLHLGHGAILQDIAKHHGATRVQQFAPSETDEPI